jgi:hypothetical protein
MSNPFLDVGYRVLALALCFYCGRQVWDGFVEGKIRSVKSSTGILDWLLDWSTRPVFHRDTAPIRYWMEMTLQTIATVGCLIAAIVGWWQPNT